MGRTIPGCPFPLIDETLLTLAYVAATVEDAAAVGISLSLVPREFNVLGINMG